MNRESAFRIPAHVVARAVGEETVILDLESGSYLGLDPVGAHMFALMGEGRTVDDICAAMLDEYDVTPAVLERDVLTLARELAAHDLVRIEE